MLEICPKCEYAIQKKSPNCYECSGCGASYTQSDIDIIKTSREKREPKKKPQPTKLEKKPQPTKLETYLKKKHEEGAGCMSVFILLLLMIFTYLRFFQ